MKVIVVGVDVCEVCVTVVVVELWRKRGSGGGGAAV